MDDRLKFYKQAILQLQKRMDKNVYGVSGVPYGTLDDFKSDKHTKRQLASFYRSVFYYIEAMTEFFKQVKENDMQHCNIVDIALGAFDLTNEEKHPRYKKILREHFEILLPLIEDSEIWSKNIALKDTK